MNKHDNVTIKSMFAWANSWTFCQNCLKKINPLKSWWSRSQLKKKSTGAGSDSLLWRKRQNGINKVVAGKYCSALMEFCCLLRLLIQGVTSYTLKKMQLKDVLHLQQKNMTCLKSVFNQNQFKVIMFCLPTLFFQEKLP